MVIPCKRIRAVIESRVAEEVAELKAQGIFVRLTTILVGSASEQLSFVNIKRQLAGQLGIEFKFIHLEKVPLYESFLHLIKKETANPDTTGVIIQLPLPPQLRSETLYNSIPILKEIEGHREKSPFQPPIGRAVLTGLKYALSGSMDYSDLVVQDKDRSFFQSRLTSKKVVLIGRGLTGGIPIAKTLTHFGIPFVNISSHTAPATAREFIQAADVIITAVGKKVLSGSDIKQGVILLNVGLRSVNGKLRGDYDEEEIAEAASAYTRTPGGLGPIDVLYLFRNLVDAAQKQLSATPSRN